MITHRPLRELMSLKGRVALITGGAGHIGSVAADGLAELGASIALIDLDDKRARDVADGPAASWGGEAAHYAVDLERSDEILKTVDEVRARFVDRYRRELRGSSWERPRCPAGSCRLRSNRRKTWRRAQST